MRDQLAPAAPLVAGHPRPLTAEAAASSLPIDLVFTTPSPLAPPLLSALPVLRPGALGRIGSSRSLPDA